MKLNKYLEERKTIPFAKKFGISRQWLWLISTGRVRPSEKLCHRIVEATNGEVALHDLRPDKWVNDGDAIVSYN